MSKPEWEVFLDSSYFDMWAVRPVGEKHFGHTFHVMTKQEADGLVQALLDAKREAYEDAAKDASGPAAWLERWAQHVGSCRGGGHCTCGLTLARAEINAIRAKAEGLK